MPKLPSIDARLLDPRHLDRAYTFEGFKTKAAWEKRAAHVRRQMRLALGLWPEPPRGPLNPVVTKRVECDGYSVENVYFESHPGFFVTGNLYRPLPAPPQPCPALLVAHGHWKEGRLVNRAPHDDSMPGLCINIARRGALAFSYDMIGYNDSCQLPHQFGKDQAEKLSFWGLSLMGLQAFNSLRAADYLLSLPEVDPARLAMTGASGGGSQTFVHAALDERIQACAPAVMVSSVMQGGCLCENAPALRIDTDNMEISALAAPRPQLLISCTGDWTSNTPSVEYPAVRRIYALYGKAAANRLANYHQHAGHNYNRNSREALYGWLGKLWFGNEDPAYAKEHAFIAEPIEALRNFPDRKPPAGGMDEAALVAYRKASAEAWLKERAPGSPAFKKDVGALLAQVLNIRQPEANEVLAREEPWPALKSPSGGKVTRLLLSRKHEGDLVHGMLALPAQTKAKKIPLTIAVHNQGSWMLFDQTTGAPGTFAAELLGRGIAVLALDTYEANPLLGKRAQIRNHDLGYNQASVCRRAQDILTAIGWARGQKRFTRVDLAGLKFAGGFALLARSQAKGVRRTLIDANGFKTAEDESYFWDVCAPGIRLSGGLPAAAALCAPAEMRLIDTRDGYDTTAAIAAYQAAGASGKLTCLREKPDEQTQAAWLAE